MLIFDVHVPAPRECEPGCSQNQEILCKHRFGRAVKVVSHTERLKTPKLSDYLITRHAFELIRSEPKASDSDEDAALKKELRGRTNENTRWAILTHDYKFWDSAQSMSIDQNGRPKRPKLTFKSNGYEPPGKTVRKGRRLRTKPPTPQQRSQAKVRGLRREWVTSVVDDDARVDIIALGGVGEGGPAQLRSAIKKAKELLAGRP